MSNKWSNGGVMNPNVNLYSWFITSRNKDNTGVKDFKQRRVAFLAYDVDDGNAINSINVPNRVLEKFKQITAAGVDGEISRLYRSVSSLNAEQIKKSLMVSLIIENRPITNIESISVSVAMDPNNHCYNEKKWLLDFDSKDKDRLHALVDEVNELCDRVDTYETPNGYAIVTSHGFDSRDILKRYSDILTIKKNAMLFVSQAKSLGISVDNLISLQIGVCYHGTISVGSTVNGCTLEDVYNIISVKEDNGDIIVYDEDGDTINVNIGNVYIVDNNIDTRLELWTNKGDKVYYLYATRDEIPYQESGMGYSRRDIYDIVREESIKFGSQDVVRVRCSICGRLFYADVMDIHNKSARGRICYGCLNKDKRLLQE